MEESYGHPEGWMPEVVWSLTVDDDVRHTAHEFQWSSVQSHLCKECYSEATPLSQDFTGAVEEELCSWCGAEDIIARVGSAQGGYDEAEYGICYDCSPLEFTDT